MTTSPDRWDGKVRMPGPIALAVLMTAPEASQQRPIMVAAAQGAPPVTFELDQLADFLEDHVSEFFVSVDVAPGQEQLLQQLQEARARKTRDALWALTAEGRWVDLRTLDRQVRLAGGEGGAKLRSWPEIVAARSDAGMPAPGELPGGNLPVILSVFESLRAAAGQIAREAAPVPRPVYEVRSPEPAEAELRRRQIQDQFGRVCNRHRERGHGGTRHERVDQPATQRERTEPREALLGQHVEVWASVALSAADRPGFAVDGPMLRALQERAMEEFRRASAMVASNPGLRACFELSEGEVSRNRRGYPETDNDRLSNWLRTEIKGLCDLQKTAPDVPRKPNGEPTLNPEHWSFWAACSRPLWAWRQLFRMAELLRIDVHSTAVRPRYETVPLLRSLEPNLTVYRTLDVPVFRPRKGHIFLAGRLSNLRACCLAAVCVLRGYAPRARGRLYQYVLHEKDPLVTAADELYSGALLAPDLKEGELEDAADHFEALRIHDEAQYNGWLWATHALLETASLGLPPSLLVGILRNDYGLEELREQEVSHLQSVLARGVAYELQGFWEDGTYDLVTARLGLTDNEGLRRFVHGADLNEAGRTVLNDLRGRRRSPVLQLLKESADNARTGDPPPQPPRRADLVDHRASTLAGRVTRCATSAAVRRHQILMAAEEVMLAVAHDLSAVGYPLLGITDSEFVLEVSEGATDEQTVNPLGQIALNAANRVFGVPLARVEISRTEEW